MKSKQPLNAAKLLIRLNPDPQAPVEWTVFDDGGCRDILLIPCEKLAELAGLPAARETHLLIPVEKALCRTLVLPDEKNELTDQQLHWLADETLDEDRPDLHWTVLSRTGTTLIAVGVDKRWLEESLATLSANGLTVTHATLDVFCLPKLDDGWTILKEGDVWLVRTHEDDFSRLTDAWLTHLLEHYPPRQLLHYGELPEPRAGGTGKPECHIMACYPVRKTTNLLHDSVRPPAPPSTARLKRVTVCCVALVAAVALLSRMVSYWHLHQLEAQLKNNLTQQWQRYIPENRHTNNLRAYLPAQLKQRSPVPLTLLLRLQSSLARFPDIALEGISYNPQQKSLRLFLYAADENNIQQFIKENTSGFSLTIDKHEQGMWTLRND